MNLLLLSSWQLTKLTPFFLRRYRLSVLLNLLCWKQRKCRQLCHNVYCSVFWGNMLLSAHDGRALTRKKVIYSTLLSRTHGIIKQSASCSSVIIVSCLYVNHHILMGLLHHIIVLCVSGKSVLTHELFLYCRKDQTVTSRKRTYRPEVLRPLVPVSLQTGTNGSISPGLNG